VWPHVGQPGQVCSVPKVAPSGVPQSEPDRVAYRPKPPLDEFLFVLSDPQVGRIEEQMLLDEAIEMFQAPAIQAIIDTRILALEKRTEAQFNRCAGLGVTRQGIYRLKHRISPVYSPIIRQIRYFEP
jgi:hypothetical protein